MSSPVEFHILDLPKRSICLCLWSVRNRRLNKNKNFKKIEDLERKNWMRSPLLFYLKSTEKNSLIFDLLNKESVALKIKTITPTDIFQLSYTSVEYIFAHFNICPWKICHNTLQVFIVFELIFLYFFRLCSGT